MSSGGIERLEAATFTLQCYQTPTGALWRCARQSLCLTRSYCAGIKFFCTAKPGTTGLEGILKVVYGLFADFVLKNPFYELDMPIRCELFDRALEAYVKSMFGESK